MPKSFPSASEYSVDPTDDNHQPQRGQVGKQYKGAEFIRFSVCGAPQIADSRGRQRHYSGNDQDRLQGKSSPRLLAGLALGGSDLVHVTSLTECSLIMHNAEQMQNNGLTKFTDLLNFPF